MRAARLDNLFSLLLNDFQGGLCDWLFMCFHCRGIPFSEHVFNMCVLSLWTAIGEPSAICVQNNEYNGLGIFSVSGKIEFVRI